MGRGWTSWTGEAEGTARGVDEVEEYGYAV